MRRRKELDAARESISARADTREEERALLSAVCLDVHPKDTMFEPGRGEHYLAVGLSALAAIERCRADLAPPTTILDFAGGYGRVLRFLRAAYPDAELTHADTDVEALRFCGTHFRATTLRSARRLDEVTLPRRYDLVWCGSLLTHLDRDSSRGLLSLFVKALHPRGWCIVSAHGDVTRDALETGTEAYGLPPEAVARVLAGYRSIGYGYASYSGSDGYGISLTTRAALGQLATAVGLKERAFLPRAWDDHHDVYGFRLETHPV